MAKRRTYTDADRARVIAALAANGGNIKRTARECDVPVQTVRNWKRKDKKGKFPAKMKQEVANAANEFIEDAERLRNKAMVQLEAKIDSGELKPKELLVAIGILSDKSQAVRNSGKAGDTNINILNLPSPKEYRQQLESYVAGIVDAAKKRDAVIDEVVEDADWEQVEPKALPPAKS